MVTLGGNRVQAFQSPAICKLLSSKMSSGAEYLDGESKKDKGPADFSAKPLF
jgi:hypothetical protein